MNLVLVVVCGIVGVSVGLFMIARNLRAIEGKRSPAIRLGDLLSDDEFDAGIMRLLILVRQGDSIMQALGRLNKSEARFNEDQFLLMGLLLGSAKELVDALSFLEARGYLVEIYDKHGAQYEHLRRDVLEAKTFLNKNDPESLYSQLLKKVRDAAGFHIKHQEVRQALSKNKDAAIRPAVVSGKDRYVEALPVVQMMMCELMAVEGLDLKQLLDDLQRLLQAATRIALDLYFIKEHKARGV